MLVDLEKKKLQFSSESSINKAIVICSHERSGTHFLMNSIAYNSNYSVEPFINFDYLPLGDIVNFHKPDNVHNFIEKISYVEKDNIKYGLSSLIKSHHPAYIFKNCFNSDDIIFFYIHRNPIDTLLSYWNFINHWDWHEGPKEKNPINFVKSIPEGQMQRYQKKSYDSIFVRWANHVSEWVEISKKYKNIYLVKYHDLDNDFDRTMNDILNFVGLSCEKIIRPQKKNYVLTNKINIHDNELKKFKHFINSSLSEFPILREFYEKKNF